MINLNSPLANGIVVTNNIVAFSKSCLSQWYGAYKGQAHKLEIPMLFFGNAITHAKMFEIFKSLTHKISFNCAEQAMMFAKAIRFNDVDTALKILETTDPRKQKDLGRSVKNYDEKIWNKERLYFVKYINFFKFSQNPELKEFLLSTGNHIICEASPWDKIWGIGLATNSPDTFDVNKWKGRNLLGRALMNVRERLIPD